MISLYMKDFLYMYHCMELCKCRYTDLLATTLMLNCQAQTFHLVSVTPGIQVDMVSRDSAATDKFLLHHFYCHDVLAYDDYGLARVMVRLVCDHFDSVTNGV